MNRLPEGYLELEYIESTGTQYINKFVSGTNANPNWKLVIDFLPEFYSDYYFLAGGYSSAYGNPCLAPFIYHQDNTFIVGIMHGKSTLSFDKMLPISRTTLEFLTNNIDSTVSIKYPDGDILTQNYTGSTGTSSIKGYPLFYYTEESSYKATIKCYSVKLYKTSSGTLLKDCVPALRTSDNKPGLYDIENDTFYINSNTSGDDFLYEYKKINNITIPDNPYIFNIQEDTELEAEFEDTRLPMYKGDKRVLSRYKGNRKVIEIYKGNTKIY